MAYLTAVTLPRRLGFACALVLCAAPVAAQTPAPQPGTPASPVPGFVTRTGVSIALVDLHSHDPRFDWAARFHGDVDVVDYTVGRLNLFGEYDAVFGKERRVFDLNHENYTIDVSATLRRGRSEFFGVIHHVSRHLTDRQNDRAVAWNAVGAAAQRVLGREEAGGRIRFDLAQVFQHTYNDYTWTAWLTGEAHRAIGGNRVLYGKAHGGFQGVDQNVVGRERLCGARVEGGLHLRGRAGGADVYLAYERRIDAFPLSYQRGRFIEIGARVGTFR